MDELTYNVHKAGYNNTRNNSYEIYGERVGTYLNPKAYEMGTCGGNHHGYNTAYFGMSK